GESPSLTLTLQDGREYPASLVIFAAGIHSQTALANSAGLKVEKGILVNEKMATSLENIYACGDCAQLNGKVMGLWSVAQAQGTIAGANAAGQERAYQSLEPNYMMNSMGTKIWSMGDIKAPDNFCQKDPQTGQLQKLFFQDNLLTGGILIGDISLQIKIKEAFKNKLGKNEALALIKK
ncbi:MAG: FAD-dependent oxidoreductase, partial [Clostridiales bacterium]